MRCGDVVLLASVFWNVVELSLAAIMIDEEFPVSITDREHRRCVILALHIEEPFPMQRLGARPGLPKPNVAHVFSIRMQVCRKVDAGDLADCRQEIHPAHHAGLIHAPCCHMPRPAQQAKGADTAFVHAAFARTQSSCVAHACVRRITDAVIFRTVVTGEKDEGVVGDLQFLKRCEEAAKLRVEIGE